MHRWSPLNNRQLALLTRVGEGADPVMSDSPKLAVTARALKERGLIAMPKKSGKWHAEITEAGRFYLKHGHHPDRPVPTPRRQRQAPAPASGTHDTDRPSPQSATAAEKPRPQGPQKQPRPAPEQVGPELIAEVQRAGRFLRITDLDDAERARYRRAFDAARQCPPAGYHLKYTGRAKGDICFGLLRVSGEDDTEWNRIRLARSRTLTDIDDVIAAVEKDHSAFEVSEEVLPRVLSLLRLFAERAFALHGEIKVSRKRKQPRPLLTVHGITYEISFHERQRQVRYVPKQPGQRTYDWQRVTPAHRFEPSGELELRLGIKTEWADSDGKRLEDQIDEVFKVVKARAQEQERARLKYEAEQRRLREEREAEQRPAEGGAREAGSGTPAAGSGEAAAASGEVGGRGQRGFDQGGGCGAGRAVRDGAGPVAGRRRDPGVLQRAG
ncbi:hypothetical protein ACIGQE_14090 [Streptomyces sp. NPDC053429]|uniref:hypothetical protein n=1 Tax=Streptomyces sp. NPDC053429 TaxID=3365702 RepID=UPI0037D8DD18